MGNSATIVLTYDSIQRQDTLSETILHKTDDGSTAYLPSSLIYFAVVATFK